MDNHTLKILFGGDICPGGMFFYTGGVSKRLSDFLLGFDYRVGTLESAMGSGFRYCQIKMDNPTGGNIIYSPDECIRILKELHVDAVSLANNHAFDNGIEGLYHTLNLLDQNGIAHFGAGRNKEEAAAQHIVNIKGSRLCFLAYYPPTMRAPYPPTEITAGLNQLIESDVIKDIHRYKSSCDYIFIMPHWGNEHSVLPMSRHLDLAKTFIDAGATGVLCSHTHTIQPAFIYKNKLIAMSMGNFCFPDRFIDSPRLSVYPEDGLQLIKKVPHTFDYPIVKTLTYKIVRSEERYGLLCGLELNEKRRLTFYKYFTVLSDDMRLSLTNLALCYRVKLHILETLFMKNRFCYIALLKVCRLLSIPVRILNKIKHRCRL